MKFSETPLEELDLPRRARAVFTFLGCHTVGEAREVPTHILLRYPNCGRKTISAIRKALGQERDDKIREALKTLESLRIQISQAEKRLAGLQDELLELPGNEKKGS